MEMQLIYHGNAGKDFKYDLDFNLSHFKSKLKSMADPNYMYEYGEMCIRDRYSEYHPHSEHGRYYRGRR